MTGQTRIEMPPLRPQGSETAPEADDRLDQDRIAYVKAQWQSQNWALQSRDRQIEENIRMLAGQHWSVRSDLLNKWIDITEFLTDEERRWRQRPVVNRLLFWFMLTHARATENPPVITFQPSTGDRHDAELAEVMDTIYKSLWQNMDMLDVVDRLFSWLIPGGVAYIKTRIDTTRGPMREWIQPTMVEGPNGPVFVPAAPYNEQGELMGRLDGEEFQQTGEPFRERQGELDVQVLSPLEVRSQWGPNPFHKKRWNIHRSLLTSEEVFDIWGVEVEPDTFGPDVEHNDALRRLLFGSGFFGAAGNDPMGGGGSATTVREGFVTVDEFWHIPTRMFPEMEQTDSSPGGRLLTVAHNKVLYDGARPAFFKGAGPTQEFEFVRLPGRPNATSPQEMLNPLQRTYNRGYAQILEHRNLTTNPITVVDDQAGVEPEQIENKPGLIIKLMMRAGVEPIRYVQPPRLGDDVYKVQAMLADEIQFLGNLEGTRGDPPTRDASGELVKELRFNTDRFLGPTMRRAVVSLGRVVEDWIAYLPLVWDEEQVIAWAGEDQVTRTVTVFPDLFKQGTINVQADIESMLPEGRGERQQRVFMMYQVGLLGDPLDPATRRTFFDLSKFPQMSRTHRPGGVDRVTAEQENGRLVRGAPAAEIPVLEWYDHEVHVEMHEQFMKSPEFLKLDPQVQEQFARHRQVHLAWIQILMQQQFEQQLQLQAAVAVADSAGDAQPGENGAGPQGQRSGGGGSLANSQPTTGSPGALPRGVGARTNSPIR